MKAIMYLGGKLELQEINQPIPVNGELLVAVEACGLSPEDVVDDFGEDMIVGRQIVGRVCTASDKKGKKLEGKRVAVIPYRTCSCCVSCRTNREHICDSLRTMGNADGLIGKHAIQGGGGQYVCAEIAQLLPVGENLPAGQLACMPIFATALEAAGKSDHILAEDVMVYGSGTLGLALVPVLNILGACSVTYVDDSSCRRKTASEMGAAKSISLQELQEQQVVYRSVFDTCCNEESQKRCIKALREKGVLVNVGYSKDRISYALRDLNGERSICNVAGASHKAHYDILKMLECGKLDAAPISRYSYKPEHYAEAIEKLSEAGSRVVLQFMERKDI